MYYWVLLGFTELYWVSLRFIELYWICTGFFLETIVVPLFISPGKRVDGFEIR